VLDVRGRGDGHELALADGRTLDCAQLVIAAGADSPALLPVPVEIGRMRGQSTRVRGRAPAPGTPILTGRGHAVPLADGWITGSSYVRDGDAGPPTADERRANLEKLEAWFRYAGISRPDDGALEVVEEFTGVRCNSADRAPLAGPCGPGLYVSAAHASSGLLTCPLAAELIAADIAGEPPVLDAELRALLDPLRFAGGVRD
jgi:tRNA 5-methylaminomethyl-2-thiouridine biosynthesis bifunctional protein